MFEEFIPNRSRRNDQTAFKDSLQIRKLETIARQAAQVRLTIGVRLKDETLGAAFE